ncbi:beta-lactamase-like protein [Dipodascopsis tothii]|uniref:beta-lactamase-like protein n=1 Tax=Dipodascopsis tothii TaxID=44089 RepID=UPI0034CD3507
MEETTCFTFSKLNASTYKVVHDDALKELPFIYVKVYAKYLVLIDTGCGVDLARDKTVQVKAIRQYIEANLAALGELTYECPETKQAVPKQFLVFITHTHYDHIGGLEEFSKDSPVFISGYSQEYVLKDLGCNSLCCAFGMKTPEFTVSHWIEHNKPVIHDGFDLGLVGLQTPGHTPDELALYDVAEHVLFAGDTIYETLPVYIIETSDLGDYDRSVRFMLEFVKGKNAELAAAAAPGTTPARVTAACGHITDTADCEKLLEETIECLWATLRGESKVREKTVLREHPLTIYFNETDNVGFMCIDTKLDAGRKHFGISL